MYFLYHYDLQNDQWNCFEDVDGHEIFICSFKTMEEAQAWCEEQVRTAVEAM